MNSRLRVMFLSMLAFFSPVALGEPGDHEKGAVIQIADGHNVVNAIISNPEIGERLREDGLRVNQMTKQQIQPGVIEFVLFVGPSTMFWDRRKKNGLITIIEDERRTYTDGPIEYTISFSIEDPEQTDSAH